MEKDNLAGLVHKAVSPKGKEARRARSELFNSLASEPNQDRAFTVISLLQGEIIGATVPGVIREAFGVLDDLVDRMVLPERISTRLVVTGDTRPILGVIQDQD